MKKEEWFADHSLESLHSLVYQQTYFITINLIKQENKPQRLSQNKREYAPFY